MSLLYNNSVTTVNGETRQNHQFDITPTKDDLKLSITSTSWLCALEEKRNLKGQVQETSH
jgi:hypothetical protein